MQQCSDVCAFGRIFVPSIIQPGAICVTAEAPGFKEIELLMPMVGPAGQMLNKLLAAAGIDRSDISIINTTCCVDLTRDDRRPTYEEIQSCQPRFLTDLMVANPSVIVSMGNVANSLFFPGLSVSKTRGSIRAWKHPLTEQVVPVVSSYHPAYALDFRSPQVRPLIVEDLRLAASLAAIQEEAAAT